MKEIIGEKIGSGKCRNVYLHLNDPTLVIKRLNNIEDFKDSNKDEWSIWNSTPNYKRIYLAPITWVSHDFQYLVMKKTTHIDQIDIYAEKGLKHCNRSFQRIFKN